MLATRSSLTLAGILFVVISSAACAGSDGDNHHDSAAADAVIIDPAGDSAAADAVMLDNARGSAASVTVTLDVSDIGTSYEGKTVYLALIPGQVDCQSVTGAGKNLTGAVVSAGAASVSLTGVDQGTYTGCAFLDADDNAQPGPGDYVVALPMTVDKDHRETSSLTGWLAIPGSGPVTPGQTRAYKVGYRELTLTDGKRGRTLKTAVWYPTVDGEDKATSAFFGGAPDASGGPYPLILFSHGDRGKSTAGQADFLKNAWAGQGFVVVAPDHQKNTTYDSDDSDANRAAIQFDRPLDIRFVTDQVLLLNADTTSFLHGMVNPDSIGISGHSFGGHTTLMVAGAPPNLDHLADACRVDPNSWDICPLQDRLQKLYPGQRVIDLSDTRMKAALSLAGDGYGWFQADGMAKIKIPTMFMVGRLDTVCPLATQAQPEYDGVLSTKYLFIQDKGDHMAYTNQCSPATSAACATLHAQIESTSVAFWMIHLKNDATYGSKLRDSASTLPDATLLSQPGK
jgi:predicted dienelactone hydrolase